MPLEKERQLPELYDLKHRFDNLPNRHFPYEDTILRNTTSPHISKNPVMANFILKLERIVSLMVEQNVLVRNYFNYTVSKYYDDHWG